MNKINPFNNDPFLHAEVARLCGKWDVEVAFETGTYQGHTTIALSLLCQRCYTAEIKQANYSQACDLFSSSPHCKNIFSRHGNSPEILEMSQTDLQGVQALYYLDAHWNFYWPLLDEMDAIAKIDAPPPIIVIHDFKVPERADLGFDSYQSQDLEFRYIEQKLDLIYGPRGYSYHYNSVAAGANRGVIFIEPIRT